MRLSKIYSDGMIIQRNAENIVEGVATPGNEVRLYFDKKIYEGTCDDDGNFTIFL